MTDIHNKHESGSRFIKNMTSTFAHPEFQKYFKNISWSLIARFTTMIIAFFVSIYVVRYLGPTNYGYLSYAVSFVGIFTFISSLGLETIIFRTLIESPEKRQELMGTALRIRLVAGGIATFTVLSFAWIFRTDNILFFLIFIISSSYILNAWQIIMFEFQAEKDQKTPALISLKIAILLNLLKLLIVFFDKGVIYLSFVFVIESFLYMIIFISSRNKKFGSIQTWRYDPIIARQLLKESWPLIFSTGFVLIYSRIDQIIIKQYLDITSVGLYDSAVRLTETWNTIPILIISAFFPAIVNAKKVSFDLYRKRVLQLIYLIGGLTFFASVFVQFVAPFIINLLYGTKFIGSVNVFRIYMWSNIWMSIGLVVYHLLILNRSTKLLALTNFSAMALNIFLNMILIPRFGINGAAFATAISYALLTIPLIFILRKKV